MTWCIDYLLTIPGMGAFAVADASRYPCAPHPHPLTIDTRNRCGACPRQFTSRMLALLFAPPPTLISVPNVTLRLR